MALDTSQAIIDVDRKHGAEYLWRQLELCRQTTPVAMAIGFDFKGSGRAADDPYSDVQIT